MERFDQLSSALADRYRLERELGAGGMAIVYLAEDTKLHRPVAIKVLRPALAAVLGAERFLQEIDVTANLQHPNILPLHDSGEADGFLYYVMPYVEGESLRDKLHREKQLGIEESVKIAEGVAAALDYAHRQGVIHRDIKPENILLRDGQALVADFGIALAVSAAGGTRLTETGLSIGTPQYMSPEQATGEREITARSDVYSLGCITYEMLVGAPPHTGATVQAILADIVASSPRPIADQRTDVPPNIAAAVRKSLAKVPGDRFASAQDFAAALVNPTFAYGSGAELSDGSRSAARRQRAIGLGLLTGILLIVSTALATRAAFSPPPAGPAQSIRFDLNLPDGSRPDGPIAVSPDGRAIVYRGVDVTHTVRLYLRRLDRYEVSAIRGTEGAWSPFFSPDGTMLGFSQDGRLRAIPVGGGTAIDLAMGGLNGSWGLDGTILYNHRRSLWRVAATGGDATLVAEPPDSTDVYLFPRFFPDGRTVLFEIIPGNRLAALSLDDGRMRELGYRGTLASPVGNDIVVFRDSSVLYWVPFDTDALKFTRAPQPLIDSVPAWFGISTEGTVAYLWRPPQPLVIVDREGQERPMPGVPPGHYGQVRYSPDGRYLAVGEEFGPGHWDIFTFDTARRTWTQVTHNGTSRWAEWTPDGEQLIYHHLGQWPYRLYTKSADGSGTESMLFERPGGHVYHGVMTPEGQQLVFWEFAINSSTGQDIWAASTVRRDHAIPLARTRFSENSVALSPDGSWLAYVAIGDGNSEVYVRRLDGGEDARRIQLSAAGGQDPRWSPDGRELFYRTRDSLMVVPIDWVGTSLRPGIPEGLLADPYVRNVGTAYYDVHPNGRDFVFVSPRADIRVAVNALADIARRP